MALPFSSWLFKAVTMKLWWSEILTSKTSLFLKSSFLFVKIRSMQHGFQDWKQDGFFIKHSRSKVFMKFSKLLFSTVRLKSPIKIVLSHWQANWPNVFNRLSRKYFSFWEGCFYNPMQSHFHQVELFQYTWEWVLKLKLYHVFVHQCKIWNLYPFEFSCNCLF